MARPDAGEGTELMPLGSAEHHDFRPAAKSVSPSSAQRSRIDPLPSAESVRGRSGLRAISAATSCAETGLNQLHPQKRGLTFPELWFIV